MTTLAKASELIGSRFHYGSQMPDGDVFSIIDLTERRKAIPLMDESMSFFA